MIGGSTKEITAMEQALQDLKKQVTSQALQGSVTSINEIGKQIKVAQGKIADANRFQRRELKNTIDQLSEQMKQSYQSVMFTQQQIIKGQSEGNDALVGAAQRAAQNIKTTLDAQAQSAKNFVQEIDSFNKSIEGAKEAYEGLERNRKDRAKEIGELGEAIERNFLKRLETGIDTLKQGVTDLSEIPTTISSKISESLNAKAIDYAKRSEEAGTKEEGTGLMKLASTFAGLAKTVMAVGAGLALVVKLFTMAEGAVKEMNKKILESASFTDLLAVSAGDAQENLKKVRLSFTDGSFSNSLGMLNDEVIALVGTLNNANLGFKALGGGERGIINMKDGMYALKEMSLALGIEMNDAVQAAERFAYQIGVSASNGAAFKSMSEYMGDIRDMAVQSTYSTANFYRQITDLVSQLDNMNLRTKEAGALFIRLGRVVGPQGVSGFLSSLASGLKGEDYLDQIKRQMLTNSKSTRKIIQTEAKRSSQAFLDTFKDSAGMDMLGGFGIDTSSRDKMLKSLQSLSVEDRQAVLGKLSMSDDTAGLGRELAKVIDIARGAAEGASRTDRSRAMDQMGTSGSIAMQYARAETYLKGRDVSELSDIDKKAMMAFTDLTKEQIEGYGKVQDQMKGQFELAKSGQLTKEQLENMGLKSEGGQLKMSKTDVAVENLTDFILAQGEALAKTGDEQPTQTDLLQQNVTATMTIADQINNHLGGYLQSISSSIMNLVNFFVSDGENEATKEARKIATEEVKGELEALAKKQGELFNDISSTKVLLTTAKGDRKKELEKKLKSLEDQKSNVDTRRKILSESINQMQQNKYGMGTLWDSDVSSEQMKGISQRQAAVKIGTRDPNALMGTVGKMTDLERMGLADPAAMKKAMEDPEMKTMLQQMYGVTVREVDRGDDNLVPDEYFVDGLPLNPEGLTKAIEATRPTESEELKLDKKKSDEANKSQTTKKRDETQAENIAKAMVKEEQKSKLMAIAESLNLQNTDKLSNEELRKKIMSGRDASNLTQTTGFSREFLEAAGISSPTPVSDLYISKGRAYKLDSKDDVLASKPGGAVDRVMGGVGGGTTFNATFHINGGGEQQAKEVVRQLENWVKSTRGGSR